MMRPRRFVVSLTYVSIFVTFALKGTESRIHSLNLVKDDRGYISLSSFGYLQGGSLSVDVKSLTTGSGSSSIDDIDNKIGFSLDKSSSAGRSSYVEHQENAQGCSLDVLNGGEVSDDTMRAIMRVEKQGNDNFVLKIYSKGLKNLQFHQNGSASIVGPSASDAPTINSNGSAKLAKRAAEAFRPTASLPVTVTTGDSGIRTLAMSFFMRVDAPEQEGLYELYFHNCRHGSGNEVSMSIGVVETNVGNYLSAGDMALPLMYGLMGCLFFAMGFWWIAVLCKRKEKVFGIHKLMAVLVVSKALSITFHSINVYFISKDGTPETWAVIFYVVHLLKGVLLFICLLLIGTGWAFIKYVLSDREKKLFMVVIPLQVFANIAYIVIHDTNEGSKSHDTWKNVMILVDVLCCGAILIPVIWSVRHLQTASQTDGKAAINLAKLKLFQHFYVMIICYLYFTRLIVYLLEITLPFQLIWIHMLFSEMGSLVFFFLTGYQFRPGCDNPYLSVPQDDDIESCALTESGLTETVSRVNQQSRDHDEDVVYSSEHARLLSPAATTAV